MATKRCSKCKQVKDLESDFHYKSKRLGTRQSQCKNCMASYAKGHYEENRDEYINRAKARLNTLRQENQTLVQEFLATHECQVCGESDPKCLTTGLSSAEILNRGSESLKELLLDCKVLCHNCQAKS